MALNAAFENPRSASSDVLRYVECTYKTERGEYILRELGSNNIGILRVIGVVISRQGTYHAGSSFAVLAQTSP